METNYEKVKHFEERLHVQSLKYFNEQLDIFDEMMGLYLEPLEEISSGWHFKEEKSPEIMLISRIFNDFESAKILILHGLTEQAHMPMRDIVESMMLFRLFDCNPKLALRWMKNLKEYSPSNIKTELSKSKVSCPEYDSLYGMLSELVHPNLLSVVHNVIERENKSEWIIQTYMFGGVNNPTWTRMVLINFLILLLMVMTEILTPAYFPVMKNPEEWRRKVISVGDRLVEFGADLQFIEIAEVDKDKLDKAKRELVTRKLKLSKIKFKLFDKQEIASDKGFPDIES